MSEESNYQKLIANVIGFIETKIDLFKLDLKEDISSVLGKIIGFILMTFLFFLTIIILSFALAGYLNQTWESNYLGFGAVGLGYLIILLVIYLFRNSSFIKQIIGKQIEKHLR